MEASLESGAPARIKRSTYKNIFIAQIVICFCVILLSDAVPALCVISFFCDLIVLLFTFFLLLNIRQVLSTKRLPVMVFLAVALLLFDLFFLFVYGT
ncbi:MAG: hypothetical protein RSA92_04915, partial [Bacteroidaceae bacterium]